MRLVFIRNRQRKVPVSARYLQRLTRELLEKLLHTGMFDLGIYLVSAAEMSRLNKAFLQHEGSTDVITFDYCSPARAKPRGSRPASGGAFLHGEIFVCLDEAVAQAGRFRATWPGELVRYVIHGILHLCGYDDQKLPARRRMKWEENRLLKEISRRFPPEKLARKSRITSRRSGRSA